MDALDQKLCNFKPWIHLRTSSAFWGVSTAAMINLTVKASPALAALTVGSATWINEPGTWSKVKHRMFGVHGVFHKWGYPDSWMFYNGQPIYQWMITRGTLSFQDISGNHWNHIITIITASNSLNYIRTSPAASQALCDLQECWCWDDGVHLILLGPSKDRHQHDMLLPTIWTMYFRSFLGLRTTPPENCLVKSADSSTMCHCPALELQDCLQLPALVMPLLSLGAVAYSCYSKGVPLFMADGNCVICLCSLGPVPAEILSCGHVPRACRSA